MIIKTQGRCCECALPMQDGISLSLLSEKLMIRKCGKRSIMCTLIYDCSLPGSSSASVLPSKSCAQHMLERKSLTLREKELFLFIKSKELSL